MLQFDISLAYELAQHSGAAYLAPDDYWQWAMDHGWDSPLIATAGSTQVGVCISPKRIIVAARGSQALGDWGENFLAFPWAWRRLFPLGRTHAGFQLQARRIARKFLRAIITARRRFPSAEIYVTGHSLGGALAPFLVRILAQSGISVAGVYTFEAPRALTTAAARWFDGEYRDQTFRVVAIRRGAADIATRLPPSALGWQHVGRPVMIRDGRLFESEEAWQAARAAHPVAPLPWWRIGSRMVAGVGAHMCAALVAELKVLASQRPGKQVERDWPNS